MKHKRKRMRQSVEARLILNDWTPEGQSWLVHPVLGCVQPRSGGTVAHDPDRKTPLWQPATPLHERRGDAFWLTANYVIKKGWA